MTLPASFPLSASQINVELGRAPTAPFDIQGAEERELAGVPSGAISFSDFLGKSNYGATYLHYTAQLTLSTTYTFSGEDFGPAQSNREIFVGVHWAGGVIARTLSSATIGGIAATIQRQTNISDSVDQSLGAAIIFAAVPTGTSGSIVLNFSGSVLMSAIGVYAVIGRNSFSDDGVDSYSGGNPIHVEVTNNTIGTNGILIAASTFSDLNGGLSWVGANETYDDVSNGGTEPEDTRYGGALITGLSPQINYTVQTNQTATSPPGGAVMAEVCIQ